MTYLLIEEDPIRATELQQLIQSILPTEVTVASSIEDARKALAQATYQLILTNVRLTDGLSLAFLAEVMPTCPIIFLIDEDESEYADDALRFENSIFVVKPVYVLSLKAAIKTVFKLADRTRNRTNQKLIPDKKATLWLRNRHSRREEVPLDEILFLKAEGNYAIIHAQHQEYVIKRSLQKLIIHLDDRFIRIQKGIIVNIDKIDRLNRIKRQVALQHYTLPIGGTFRQEVLRALKNR